MKRFITALLALVLALCSMGNFVIPASAEATHIRKIVSVVYDDSGSMLGDKWAYANYAMQAFCGMLNSEDQLYITYMSRSPKAGYSPEKIDLSAGGIQKSVDTIRNHSENDNTPFSAVQKAFDKLKSVKDSEKTTQYWLVIITDGDFNECSSYSEAGKIKFADDYFNTCTSTVMPNGSNPKITFMGIGSGVVMPTADQYKGIYTYPADDANDIIAVMNSMADMISGRTRLSQSDIKLVDSRTVQVSSSIPILNIAVFSQAASANITSAQQNNGKEIPISRHVSLGYNGYSNLTGGAFLLGDSKSVIGKGTYNITFEQDINLNNIVVLLEPAIEVRVSATVNGEEITDFGKFEGVPAGENVSAAFKLYEIGTDNEIDPSDMPAGTEYELSFAENGQVVKQNNEMTLSDYNLKNTETEISAKVTIPGFNPIGYAAKFNPGKNVKYTLTPGFAGTAKSVRFDKIAQNRDLSVCFTVSADGKVITDPEVIKTFNPVITVTPSGNSGEVTYSPDGKIVFTPNACSPLTPQDDNLPVDVVCTIDGGVSATQPYMVITGEYGVVVAKNDSKIKKTEFFGNTSGISFYITKDGVNLKKSDVENKISVMFDEKYMHLNSEIVYEDDGMITVIPKSDEQHKVTFLKWWTNWLSYFRMPGSNMTVNIAHTYASGSGVIDVTGAGVWYQILNVYLPLLLELLLIAMIIAYIIRYFTKPRFASNACLYVGSIGRTLDGTNGHSIKMRAFPLAQYNTFAYLWNPFKELTATPGNISITALKANRIKCNENSSCFTSMVEPKSITEFINSPNDIVNYCRTNHQGMTIKEIKIANSSTKGDTPIRTSNSLYYFIKAKVTVETNGYLQREVVERATVFCYSTI